MSKATPQEALFSESLSGSFVESLEGSKYRIRVIRSGLSGNRNRYPDAVLREAVPLFNGVRVFVKSDQEHLKGQGKDFRNLIGRLTNPQFIEGRSPDTGEIQADLELLESAEVSPKLREAVERDMADDLFGFSIDATGDAVQRRGRIVEAQRITKVNSVDLIIEPGAGGKVIQMIEAVNQEHEQEEEQTDVKLRQRMIEAIKTAHKGTLPQDLDIEDDGALETAYREALQNTNHDDSQKGSARNAGAGGGQDDPAPAGVSMDDVNGAIRMVEARSHMRAAIAESGLPDKAKAKLRQQFSGLAQFTEAQVDRAVADEREYLAGFTHTGRVTGMGEGSFIEAGEDRSEKIGKMLDGFFDGSGDVRSFKECYVEITGDRLVTGHLQHCNPTRLREALGNSPFREAISASTFADVLGDSITRRMIADYRETGQYDVWRNLVNIVPLADFRTQERTRFGGYGDLPAVAENGSYNPLTSPTDEKATYAATKRGGTETISLETIKNDDVGVIRRIPLKLSRSGKRTLAKFVLDFLRTNPTIYDGAALFHASHGNLGTAALSAASLAAGRLAMLQQTELDSGDRIGIGPQNLWVPGELEETAVDLFRRNTENDKNFVQTLSLNVIPVWYWTDANDWCLSADPMDIPTIEIGFLDGNEEPELFVQDNPTQGSLFTNDQIKYKIRHIYGGNVEEFRGLYKGVVA